MIRTAVNGLVLAGGRSTRMGLDKSEVQYFDKPQRDYAAEILRPFCKEVLISSRKILTETSAPVLYDRFPEEGPLSGILTALQHRPDVAWLTVPVDMPNLDAGLIAFLIQNRKPEKTATCFLDSTGKHPEPLLAIWEPAASSKIFHYYSAGGRSPREFLLNNPVELLTVPDPNYLVNINTPEDLSEFRKTLQERQRGK